jgi:hypothetical protein
MDDLAAPGPNIQAVGKVKRKVVKAVKSDLALLQCELLRAEGCLVEQKTRAPESTSAGRYSNSVDVRLSTLD